MPKFPHSAMLEYGGTVRTGSISFETVICIARSHRHRFSALSLWGDLHTIETHFIERGSKGLRPGMNQNLFDLSLRQMIEICMTCNNSWTHYLENGWVYSAFGRR